MKGNLSENWGEIEYRLLPAQGDTIGRGLNEGKLWSCLRRLFGHVEGRFLLLYLGCSAFAVRRHCSS